MKDFVKEMITEHSQLVLRIGALSDSVYNEENTDDKVEFANKAIQLAAMRKYEEALRARLENQNILYSESGEYFEKVGEVGEVSDVMSVINEPNNNLGNDIPNVEGKDDK